jgi:hypothetical protein
VHRISIRVPYVAAARCNPRQRVVIFFCLRTELTPWGRSASPNADRKAPQVIAAYEGHAPLARHPLQAGAGRVVSATGDCSGRSPMPKTHALPRAKRSDSRSSGCQPNHLVRTTLRRVYPHESTIQPSANWCSWYAERGLSFGCALPPALDYREQVIIRSQKEAFLQPLD